MNDPDYWVELSHKADRERLRPDEIDSILRRLTEDIDPYDRYPLIDALGSVRDPAHASAVEPFLRETAAPQIAGLALRVLCTDLKLSDHYVEQIAAFVDGLPWDVEEDARLVAIQVAGEHLRRSRSAELLERLIAIAQSGQEREPVRDTARAALARAVGVDWKDLRRLSKTEIMRRAQERMG
jgi:hypothetical protein